MLRCFEFGGTVEVERAWAFYAWLMLISYQNFGPSESKWELIASLQLAGQEIQCDTVNRHSRFRH